MAWLDSAAWATGLPISRLSGARFRSV